MTTTSHLSFHRLIPVSFLLGWFLLGCSAAPGPQPAAPPKQEILKALDPGDRARLRSWILAELPRAETLSSLAGASPDAGGEQGLAKLVAEQLASGTCDGLKLVLCGEAGLETLVQGFHRGLDISALAALVQEVKACHGAVAALDAALADLDRVPGPCLSPERVTSWETMTTCLALDGRPLPGLAELNSAIENLTRTSLGAIFSTLVQAEALLARMWGKPPMEVGLTGQLALCRLIREPAGFWAMVEPGTNSYQGLVDAHQSYSVLASSRAWDKIDSGMKGLRKGRKGLAVISLDQRLAREGYVEPRVWDQGRNSRMDKLLEEGLKAFQKDHGLSSSGRVDSRTLKALGISPLAKLARLRLALRSHSRAMGPPTRSRIVIHIPAAVAEVYLDGALWRTLRVVVGKAAKRRDPETGRKDFAFRTPSVTSLIHTIVINPKWVVPDSIKEFELDPLLFDEPDYYETHGYEVKTYSGGREVLVQKPGPGNALGRVKFLFTNPFGVYLHDTPARSLFKRPVRLFSHGCVRVDRALELGSRLLAWDQGIGRDSIEAVLGGEQPWAVRLKTPLPIAIVYATADAYPGRRPWFYPDWYELETEELEQELSSLPGQLDQLGAYKL